MNNNISKILFFLADMDSFADFDDSLSETVNIQGDELNEDDLDLVSAASSSFSYAEFLHRINDNK